MNASKRFLRVISLIALFFSLGSLAMAQESQRYLLPISDIQSLGNNVFRISLEVGTRHGLKTGASCEVWGTYSNELPTRDDQALARGRVVTVSESAAAVEVKLTGDISIEASDRVAVMLQKSGYLGIMNKMIQWGISFIDIDDQPIYGFDQVFFEESEETEKVMLDSLSSAVRRTGEYLVGNFQDQTIQGGLFDGQSLLETMIGTTPENVKSFLMFVHDYPAKYLGKTWRISETYATWLISKTPLSTDELWAALDDISSEGQLEAFYQKFQFALTTGEVEDLGRRTETMAEAGDTDNAHRKMNLIMGLTERLAEDNLMGWSCFQRARIFYFEKDYKQAIDWYQKAYDYFLKTDDAQGAGFAVNNIANCYNQAGDYVASTRYYKEAIKIKQAYYDANATTGSLRSLGISFWGIGDSYYDKMSYDSAQSYFETAVWISRRCGDFETVISRMENVADCMAKKGFLDEANAIHEKRYQMADSLDLKHVMAGVLFDQGYSYNGYGKDYMKGIPYYQKSYEMHLAIGDTSMATLSMSNIGQSYWSLKNLDKAIEHHLKTIALAEQSGEKTRIANSWDKLADLYGENGNPKESLKAYDKVIRIYEELDHENLASTLKEVGEVYKDAKDYLKAISYFRRSAKISEQRGDLWGTTDSYFEIASTYFDMHEFQLSKEFYEMSRQAAVQAGDFGNELAAMSNIGLLYSNEYKFDQADSIFNYVLKKADSLGSNTNVAYCTWRLGSSYERQRRYDEAKELYRKSMDIYKELEEHYWVTILYSSLAWAYASTGEFEKAEELYDEGLVIAERENDRYNIASLNRSKADIYARIYGEFDKAWELESAAFKTYEEVDNTWGMASSYLGLGNIKNIQGEYGASITYYQKSDSLYLDIGDEYSRATLANNIGVIYFKQGDNEKAIEEFNRALEIYDRLKIKDSGRSLTVGNIGEVKLEQKKYEEAERWLSESLLDAQEINDANQISTGLVLMGRLKLDTEQLEQARSYLQRALKLQQDKKMRLHEISTRFSLGKLAYLQKDASGYHFLDESIELATEMGVEREKWEAYYYKGLVARQAGKLDKSKEFLILAIETLESIQSKVVGGEEAKKIFASGEKQMEVYSALVDVLVENGEVELALQYLERSNVESLRNKFKQLKISFKDEKTNKKLEEERALKLKLDNLDRAIANEKSSGASAEKLKRLESNRSVAENEYLKFVNTTINSNPELSRHFSGGFHPKKLKTDKNRRLIPDDLIVVSYLPSNSRLFIFTATADTVVAKVVDVTGDELNKQIKFLRNVAVLNVDGHKTDPLRVVRGESPDPPKEKVNTEESEFKKVAYQMYQWTIEPIEEQINKKRNVVIVPSGMLHFLPFQMTGEIMEDGRFEYLIERHSLFYAHSLDMLYQEVERMSEISILAMANADRSLPSTEKEVEDLKSLYPDTDVFIHEQATEDKAKVSTGQHNILHFATHGNLDYFDYHKSYLTLAPNKEGSEDGKLTIEEVWEIEDIYNYQLVTLSACETAVTDDYSTGWAVSPATSFIDAGAPTVVASLWKVSDESTAILMKYFYRNLKNKSKVEALRRAQIELSQHPEYNHPYYWSPFILIGNWR